MTDFAIAVPRFQATGRAWGPFILSNAAVMGVEQVHPASSKLPVPVVGANQIISRTEFGEYPLDHNYTPPVEPAGWTRRWNIAQVDSRGPISGVEYSILDDTTALSGQYLKRWSRNGAFLPSVGLSWNTGPGTEVNVGDVEVLTRFRMQFSSTVNPQGQQVIGYFNQMSNRVMIVIHGAGSDVPANEIVGGYVLRDNFAASQACFEVVKWSGSTSATGDGEYPPTDRNGNLIIFSDQRDEWTRQVNATYAASGLVPPVDALEQSLATSFGYGVGLSAAPGYTTQQLTNTLLLPSEINFNAVTTPSQDQGLYALHNKWVWARIKTVDNQIYAKLWRDGQPEPTNWTIGVVDPTNEYASGWVGIATGTEINWNTASQGSGGFPDTGDTDWDMFEVRVQTPVAGQAPVIGAPVATASVHMVSPTFIIATNAKYVSTNFFEYPENDFPHPDWSVAWTGAESLFQITPSIQTASGTGVSDRVLQHGQPFAGLNVAYWQAPFPGAEFEPHDGTIDDAEMLVKFQATNVDRSVIFVVRGSGAAGSENGYLLYSGGDNGAAWQASKIVNGQEQPFMFSIFAVGFVYHWQPGNWYWMRLRIKGATDRPDGVFNGTTSGETAGIYLGVGAYGGVTFAGKMWADGDPEPAAEMFSYLDDGRVNMNMFNNTFDDIDNLQTDPVTGRVASGFYHPHPADPPVTSPINRGWFGLGSYSASGLQWYGQVSVKTNMMPVITASAAPISPAFATAQARVPTFGTNLSRVAPTGSATASTFDPTTYTTRPQYSRPMADLSTGGWTDQNDGTANLYTEVNETIPNDASYIKSSNTPVGDATILKLATVTPPDVNDPGGVGYTLRYRFRKRGANAENLTVNLLQGTTVVASWVEANVDWNWATAEKQLTTDEVAAISDFTDLRLQLVGDTA